MSTLQLGVEALLKRNLEFAKKHEAIPTFAELAEMGVDFPHIIVLTCADPRCQPEKFLNIQSGEGVIIMRNAGGHVSPALTGILALDSFVRIDEIMIVHHTDCGTIHFKDNKIRDLLKARVSEDHYQALDKMTFGAIDDLKESVVDDINILRDSPFIRPELAEKTYGFVYDLKSGKLEAVKV